MAVTLVNSLFPPYVDTFMPAFLNTENARIYFSISPYNSSEDINLVHISLTSQLTNENALVNSTGIYVTTLSYDTERELYFVDIPLSAVSLKSSDGRWLINQYYKVQIRFDNTVTQATQKDNSYFISNIENFSEWSTICLIRAIKKPELYLKLFDTGATIGDENTSSTVAFNKGIIPITGSLYFQDDTSSTETETMREYYIEILDENKDSVLETPIVYTAENINPNEIYYRLDVQGLSTDSSSNFTFRIHYTTKNLYTGYKDYDFTIADYVIEDTFDPTISVAEDNVNGIVTIKIVNPNSVFGILYVKRASNLTNYKEWENIYVASQSGSIDLTIEDNTVGSMVWYRYSVQLENVKGALTQITYSPKVILDFYDAIISRKEQQAALRYNYKINSFKPNVSRVKVDTIGSKYPRFLQNGQMNYRQFTVTGLISAQTDEDEKFLNKQDTLNEYNNYLVYNESNDINEDYDFYWEREFRERLVSWLNDGEPKLYRSQTEGNIAVIISDVSLTPNATLSRRLWDITMTLTEIADGYSLSTLDSLGIYEVADSDTISPDETIDYVEVSKPGQIYLTGTSIFQKNDILHNYIATELEEKYAGVLSDKETQKYSLSDVKIHFHNKPHIFARLSNNNLQLITPSNIELYNPETFLLGYTFSLSDTAQNSLTFFVNESGYYEIPDDVNIEAIYFPQTDDIITMEYILSYQEKSSASSVISGRSIVKTVLGQESRIFQAGERIGDEIRKKYIYTVPDEFYQKMDTWRGICIDAIPFAVVKIMYQGSVDWVTAEIGITGRLNLLKNVNINNIQFVGRRLSEIPIENLSFANEWEYCVDDSVYYSIENIEFPHIHTVYNINGTYYIYYIDNTFYQIDLDSNGTGIAKVPVDASVNYIGNIVRTTYQ